MHSNAQDERFMALRLGCSTASYADLMVVLVESEPLQFKPIKNRAAQQLWKFSVRTFWGTMTSKTGNQNNRLPAEQLKSIFELGTKHLALAFVELSAFNNV